MKPHAAVSAPLRGIRALITRPIDHDGALRRALESRGARTLHLPLSTIRPVPVPESVWADAIVADWLVFSSVNGVQCGWAAAPEPIRDVMRHRMRVAAVGPATARAAEECGLHVVGLPRTYVAESLADFLEENGASDVLWLRGADARGVLAERIRSVGGSLREIVVYRTTPLTPASLPALDRSDVVTLMSASTARQFARIAHLAGGRHVARIACLGPVTAAAALDAGLHVDAVAGPCTIDGLIDAIADLVKSSIVATTA